MIEEFARGNSIIHELDPRIKVIFGFILSIVIALTLKLSVAICGLGIALLLVIVAKLKLRKVLKRLLLVNIFILPLWIILPFSYPGEKILGLGRFTLTREGIIYALLITLKCNAIVMIGMAMFSTSEVFHLTYVAKKFRLPDKLIYLLFLIWRYIFVLEDEYNKLRNAVLLRGFVPKTNLHTYKTFGFLIGTIFLKSYEHGENIYRAMALRGFDGRFRNIEEFKLKKKDFIGILGFILLTGTLFLW